MPCLLQGQVWCEYTGSWGGPGETGLWVCFLWLQVSRKRVESVYVAGLQLCSKQVRIERDYYKSAYIAEGRLWLNLNLWIFIIFLELKVHPDHWENICIHTQTPIFLTDIKEFHLKWQKKSLILGEKSVFKNSSLFIKIKVSVVFELNPCG